MMDLHLTEFAGFFARPWLLTLLVCVPILALLGWRAERWRRRALAQLTSSREVVQLREADRSGRIWSGLALQLGLMLLIVAAAGPQWGRDWGVATTVGRDLIVVVDVSRSMTAEQPSRIELAQRALTDLLTALRQRGGHRVGVVLFAGRSKVVCPLTQDYDHVGTVLGQLDDLRNDPELGPGPREASGTRIGLGIVAALRARDEYSQGVLDVLLLSDGDDPSGDLEWEFGVLEARGLNVPVSVIGLGDPVRDSAIPNFKDANGRPVQTRLYEDSLRKIASETGGEYIPAQRLAVPLGRIYLDSIVTLPRRGDPVDQLPTFQARYPWFLVPALILLGLGMRRRE